jgi:hypothetical protein
MYPAAVCPPPCRDRFAARPATARPRRLCSAHSAARPCRTRHAPDHAVWIARSSRVGYGPTAPVTPPSVADRRLAEGTTRGSRRIGRFSPSRRTSWSSPGAPRTRASQLTSTALHPTSMSRHRRSSHRRSSHRRSSHRPPSCRHPFRSWRMRRSPGSRSPRRGSQPRHPLRRSRRSRRRSPSGPHRTSHTPRRRTMGETIAIVTAGMSGIAAARG